ncbi:hypothetical protein AVEN_23457-1 [Araneus ventricosus]|uniref:Estradiol 17-beta-dehydrogenase 2 n=1 Tax=Araneus ventricosus TaxID=182803 RepID=A0A4Y2EAT4_ARAVE|nr:hypothetical protein AVEN_23457-1 [Araneus ventricosus]
MWPVVVWIRPTRENGKEPHMWPSPKARGFCMANQGLLLHNLSGGGGGERRLAFPMIVPYSMSKFACVGFSESLRYELDLWGVRVISIEPEFFETDMTTERGISDRVDAMLATIDEDVRKDFDEEFLKAFKRMISTLFPPSPDMQKLIETIECAVTLEHPDTVYKVCRNFGLRASWTVWDVLPEEFKVFILRIIFNLFGLSRLGQGKKSL